MHIERRLLAGACLPLMAWCLSGCLAYEIRDELRLVNASLEDVKIKLNSVNDGLLRLERTNTLLADLDMKLTALESTNASLSSIDAHLASLRKTLNRIDSTIPFLKVSGDDTDEPIETAEQRAARQGQPPAQPGQDTPAEPSKNPPSQPASEPASGPASGPASQPTSEPSSPPAADPATPPAAPGAF